MAVMTKAGILDKEAFAQANITLPQYKVDDIKKLEQAKGVQWLHFGPGNISRFFLGEIVQELLNAKEMHSGLRTISLHDATLVDVIYKEHDNLNLNVTLLPEGELELEVLASIFGGYKLNGSSPEDEQAVLAHLRDPNLQLISYTITEKGYGLTNLDGSYLEQVQKDMVSGPNECHHAMSVTAKFLYERFKHGKTPLALVSMDNCSHNGTKFKDAVVTIAKAWANNGFVEQDFVEYLEDKQKIAFPCSMIDKITPGPDADIAKMLKDKGLEGMELVKTSRGGTLAPFVNAEKPKYLVIEDCFPNGRPPLEKTGVIFTDAQGVDLCERMKVTTCLNPLHTALAVLGCVLGYTRINAEMEDQELVALVKKLGYDEGMAVVTDPKILNPQDFLTEVIEKRLPNKFLPDAPQRIASDTSQKVPIRFGITLKSYQEQGKDITKLVAIPLAIAGWMRYLLALDDQGQKFELSADPLLPELREYLKDVEFGKTESVKDALKPILSNKSLFLVDLYEIGLAPTIETMFKEMIAGKGATRATLQKYLTA